MLKKTLGPDPQVAVGRKHSLQIELHRQLLVFTLEDKKKRVLLELV
jgi:hypothetical protein